MVNSDGQPSWATANIRARTVDAPEAPMAASSARLLVLGLLQGRPMRGYELMQVISRGTLDRWTSVLPGSIYHALARMQTEGLVRIEAEVRTGDRIRNDYAITPKGREALLALLRDTLARPPHDLRSDFALAALWMDALPRDELLDLLEDAAARLDERQRQAAAGRAAKASVLPVAEALFDNADAIVAADSRLLERLRELVGTGLDASA
jgi:DNA-binding PadR family transcriptional regulator